VTKHATTLELDRVTWRYTDTEAEQNVYTAKPKTNRRQSKKDSDGIDDTGSEAERKAKDEWKAYPARSVTGRARQRDGADPGGSSDTRSGDEKTPPRKQPPVNRRDGTPGHHTEELIPL
jgi:hypothetical protein